MALFAENYAAKYERAVACLVKDRDALLTCYDFPQRTATICERRIRSARRKLLADERRTSIISLSGVRS